MKTVMYAVAVAGALFLVAPILALVPMSFSGTRWLALPPRDLSFRWYVAFLTDREWLGALATTLQVATLATIGAGVLGTLGGVGLARTRFPGQALVRGLLVAPLIVPVMIMAIAFYYTFARLHLIGTVTGIVLAHVVLASPFVVVNVEAVMRTFDVRLERAARTLGATAGQAFRRVTLPLIRPGVLAGALFAFIFSVDEVVVAMFLAGTSAITLPKLMFDSITQDELNPVVTAIASLQIGAALAAVILAEALRARGARLALARATGDDPMEGRLPAVAPEAPGRAEGPGGHSAKADSLHLVRVSKRFGMVTAVEEASLDVEAGEFLTLLGPSGSGKTTILNLVAGFENPTSGEIYMGRNALTSLPPNRRGIGMVFQDYALFPHLTVFDNVAFPLRLRRLRAPVVASRVTEMLEVVRLVGLEGRYPRQLSGGQQQRVALARALVFHPPLLLMDEPLGALDKNLRERMQAEIRQLHRRLGITVLFVTHDQQEAMALSDRIVVLDHGRIQQVGRPSELYLHPANEFVAAFIGESNLLRCHVAEAAAGGARLITEGGTEVWGPRPRAAAGRRAVTLLIRPEALRLHAGNDPRTSVEGRVDEAVYLGDVHRYTVRINPRETLVVRVANRLAPEIVRGAAVVVSWDPADARLLEDP
jgi:spermidine/putrescine ABC transporter ATP-binding subunit